MIAIMIFKSVTCTFSEFTVTSFCCLLVVRVFNLVYVCITLLEFSSVNLKRKSFCDFVVDKSKLRMKGLKPPLRDLGLIHQLWCCRFSPRS